MVDRAQKKVIAISVLVVFIMILSSAFLGGNLIKGRKKNERNKVLPRE